MSAKPRTRSPRAASSERGEQARIYRLALDGGPLAGGHFELGDWPASYDEPPSLIWLAELDGAIVGLGPDKDVLNAVAQLARCDVGGWVPYERATADGPIGPAPAEPVGGIYAYAWARRVDPATDERRQMRERLRSVDLRSPARVA